MAQQTARQPMYTHSPRTRARTARRYTSPLMYRGPAWLVVFLRRGPLLMAAAQRWAVLGLCLSVPHQRADRWQLALHIPNALPDDNS